MIKQDRGSLVNANGLGTTSANATIPGVANRVIYITDVSASSDLSTGTMSISSGSTILWQNRVSNTDCFSQTFSSPLTMAIGASAQALVTGTTICYINISGFTLNTN